MDRGRIRIVVAGLVEILGSAFLLAPTDPAYRCGEPISAGCDRLNATSLGATRITVKTDLKDLF